MASGGSLIKNLPASAGDAGSNPGWRRSPGGGHGNSLQYSCLENPWTEELAGCTLWGLKESDTTERLSTPAHSTAQTCGVAASLFLTEEAFLLGVKS